MMSKRFLSDEEKLRLYLSEKGPEKSVPLKDLYSLAPLFVRTYSKSIDIQRTSLIWSTFTQDNVRRAVVAYPNQKCLFQNLERMEFVTVVPPPERLNTSTNLVNTYAPLLDNNFPQVSLPCRPNALRSVVFSSDFPMPMKGFDLPPTVERVTLQESFNLPLDTIRIPSSILFLDVGIRFNQPLPSNMDKLFPNLQILVLGNHFDQPLGQDIQWPKSLHLLVLGTRYSQSNVVFPSTIKVLVLKGTIDLFKNNNNNTNNSSIILPIGLKRLDCSHRQSIWTQTLPEICELYMPTTTMDVRRTLEVFPTLRSLSYDKNTSFASTQVTGTKKSKISTFTVVPHKQDTIELEHKGLVETCYDDWHLSLPMFSNLKHLHFPGSFDMDLEGIPLPNTLESLVFEDEWDQSLHFITKLGNLRKLILSDRFNQPLDEVTIPKSLRTLVFGSMFNQSLRKVKFPHKLHTLIFGGQYDRSMRQVILPSKLRRLEFGYNWNRSVEHLECPTHLEVLTFGPSFQGKGMHLFKWPQFLRELTLGEEFVFDLRLLGFNFAPSIETLVLGMTKYPHPLSGVRWPYSCGSIRLHESMKQNFMTGMENDRRNNTKDTDAKMPSKDCRISFHRQLRPSAWVRI